MTRILANKNRQGWIAEPTQDSGANAPLRPLILGSLCDGKPRSKEGFQVLAEGFVF